jgi:YVTN family beta-propeller protein
MAVAVVVLGVAGLLATQLGLARNAQAQPVGTPWSVYVANSASSAVSVIDNQTGAVTATIPVAPSTNPWGSRSLRTVPPFMSPTPALARCR